MKISSSLTGFKKWSLFCAGILLFILGLSVIIGWFTHNLPLIQINSTFPPMQFTTAVHFLFFGIGFIFLTLDFKKISRFIALYLIAWSCLVLIEYIFAIDLKIDELFFKYNLDFPNEFHGRMAPNTAACFILGGISFIIISFRFQYFLNLLVLLFSSIIISISAIALFGYLSGLDSAIGWLDYTGMAVHTTCGTLLIGLTLFSYELSRSFSHHAKFAFGPIVAVFICTMALNFAGWQSFNSQSYLNIRKIVNNDANYIEFALESSIEEDEYALKRMAKRWEATNGYTQSLWKEDATNYLNDIYALTNIATFDKDFQERSQLVKQPYDKINLSELIKKNSSSLNEFKKSIIASEEKNIFIIIFPLFANDKPDGYLAGVFHLNLLAKSKEQSFSTNLHVDILEKNQLVYEGGNLSSTIIGKATEKLINIGPIEAVLKIYITEQLIHDESSFLPFFVLIAGACLSLCVVLVAYFGQLAYYKEKKLASTLSDLSQANAFRRAILESSGYSIIATDINGIITSFNKAAEELLGYKSEEICFKKTPGLFHDILEMNAYAKELSEEFKMNVAPNFNVFVTKAKMGVPREKEWTYISKNQKRIPVNLKVTALKDDKGIVIGFVGIAFDLTERKRIESMKNELISITTHELRRPLTAIFGAIEIIEEIGQLPKESAPFVTIAHQNCDRLIRLINDILDVQKMEAGRQEYSFKPLSVPELFSKAFQLNRILAIQNDIQFKEPKEIPPLFISGDENRLLQALGNLIGNAIKYSPKDEAIEFFIHEKNNHLRIEIQNHGPAIPKEFYPLIFQKFARANIPEIQKKQGTGLGLSITKSIIEKHGGTIGFESTDQVTTFWVELPLITNTSQ